MTSNEELLLKWKSIRNNKRKQQVLKCICFISRYSYLMPCARTTTEDWVSSLSDEDFDTSVFFKKIIGRLCYLSFKAVSYSRFWVNKPSHFATIQKKYFSVTLDQTMTLGFQFNSDKKCPEPNGRLGRENCSLHFSMEPWCCSQARPCSILMWWPIQMQEESHNYKAFTVCYDPSFQYPKGKETFIGKETQTQWDQETWPESKAGLEAERGPSREH